MMSNPAIIISRPAAPPAPLLNLPLPLRRLIKRTSTWALSGEDYGYDPNGNLIYDRHRKITAINYNAIDRPAQIRFLQGDTISYIYTATGEKLAEISRSADGLSDLRRDYYGPFEFINGSHDRTNYPQGYMDCYGWMYVYIPDYQGNILGIYNAATGRLDQFTDYYPYGQPHPDCTSPELNRRKFGAKELTTSFGLNEYDFAARRLSPLGAFTQPDPLAGSLTDPQSGDRLPQPYLASLSPYSYCAADPINLIDPSGEDWIHVKVTDDIVWRDDVTSPKNTPIGCTYIGATDESIVSFLFGYKSLYHLKDWTWGVGPDGDNNISILIPTVTHFQLFLHVLPMIDKGVPSEFNKEGKIYVGLKVSMIFYQRNTSPSPFNNIYFMGGIYPTINGHTYKFSLYDTVQLNNIGNNIPNLCSDLYGYTPSFGGFRIYFHHVSALREFNEITLKFGGLNNNVIQWPIKDTIKLK